MLKYLPNCYSTWRVNANCNQGLDPAEPAFDLAGPNGRLDRGDAELVDIIHTNSGMLWQVVGPVM